MRKGGIVTKKFSFSKAMEAATDRKQGYYCHLAEKVVEELCKINPKIVNNKVGFLKQPQKKKIQPEMTMSIQQLGGSVSDKVIDIIYDQNEHSSITEYPAFRNLKFSINYGKKRERCLSVEAQRQDDLRNSMIESLKTQDQILSEYDQKVQKIKTLEQSVNKEMFIKLQTCQLQTLQLKNKYSKSKQKAQQLESLMQSHRSTKLSVSKNDEYSLNLSRNEDENINQQQKSSLFKVKSQLQNEFQPNHSFYNSSIYKYIQNKKQVDQIQQQVHQARRSVSQREQRGE